MKNADYYEVKAQEILTMFEEAPAPLTQEDDATAISAATALAATAQAYATLAVAAALDDLPITAKRIDIGIGTVTTAIENLEQAVRR